MIDAETVLEPGMVGRRIDEGDRPELADVPESLDSRGVDEFLCDPRYFDVVVDTVLDASHWREIVTRRYKRFPTLHAVPDTVESID
jgi:hypothetical protein